MRALVSLLREFVDTTDRFVLYSFGKEIWYREPIIEDKDQTYQEDRVKKWSDLSIMLYGFVDADTPSPVNTFGVDSPDEGLISLNYAAVKSVLKGPPKIGAMLEIGGDKWIIVNRKIEANKWLGEYRLNLTCSRYVENVTTGPCK